jgi:nucleoside-triphosphatase THEP1
MLAGGYAVEVVIITGAIDSGKTSYCERELAARGEKSTRGILLKKVFRAGEAVGYDAHDIGSRRRAGFARRLGRLPAGWREAERVGCFSISRAGKASANRWLAEALAASPGELIIDEVGPLETRGGGLAASVRLCLEADPPGLTLYLVVRSGWLDQVRAAFALQRARLLPLPPG